MKLNTKPDSEIKKKILETEGVRYIAWGSKTLHFFPRADIRKYHKLG